MTKKRGFKSENSFINVQGCTKILWVVVLYTLFLAIPLVSSFEFDNQKTYDPATKTATINDCAVWLVTCLVTGDKLADVKLNSEVIEYVLEGKDRKVAEWVLSNYKSDYTNALSGIDFYNLRKDNKKINREFTYKYAKIIGVNEIPVYETVCAEELANKTIVKICKSKLLRVAKEDVIEWVAFKELSELPIGDVRIGLFTDVLYNDHVEFYPYMFGVKQEQWAEWVAAYNINLISYWDFQETSGDLLDKTGTGHINSTTIPTTINRGVTGINGFAYNSSNVGDTFNIAKTSDYDMSTSDKLTISSWIYINSNISLQKVAYTKGEYNLYIGTDGLGSGQTSGTIYQSDTTPIEPTYGAKSLAIERWYNIVLNANGTDANLWINGTRISSIAYDGTIRLTAGNLVLFYNGKNYKLDEMAVWNRSLSDAEIIDLGTGTFYLGVGGNILNITSIILTQPTNNTNTLNASLTFNSTFAATASSNFTNATLYIWNSTNSIFATNTTIKTGTTNDSSLSFSGFTIGNYKWNYLICATNITDNQCKMANSNYTFSIISYTEGATTFNSSSYETSNESFTLSITTLPSILSINSQFIYNGTKYPASSNCIGLVCNLTANINLPLVNSGTGQNNSFYFNLTVFDGSISIGTTSTINYQNVSRIYLDNCSASTTRAFNFTAWNEPNETIRTIPFVFGGTFNYFIGGGSTYRNFSFANTTATEVNLCVYPNATYKTNANIEYGDNNINYNTRNLFLINQQYSNTTQNINLYLLEKTLSTSFILLVQDNALTPISDAYIFIQRYYPATDTFKTVQVAKTSEFGKSIGFFQAETADYRFMIYKNGLLIYQSNMQKIAPEESPYTIIFTIGTTPNPIDVVSPLTNLFANLTFNPTTNIVSFTYIDTSPNFTQGRLYIEVINVSNFYIVCNTTSALSTATINCNLNAYNGTFIAKGYITRGSVETIVQLLQGTINNIASTFGMTGLLIAFILIMVASCAFIWSIVAGIGAVNITIILLNIMGLVNFGWAWVAAMIAISVVIIISTKQ